MKNVRKYSSLIVSSLVLVAIVMSAIVLTTGTSMKPSHGNLGIMIANPFPSKIERFDVVVIQGSPILNGKRIYKRVIGLPGELVEVSMGVIKINGVVLNDKYTTWNDTKLFNSPYRVYLKDGEYVVMGDNQPFSGDSFSYKTPVLIQHIKSKEIFYLKILD